MTDFRAVFDELPTASLVIETPTDGAEAVVAANAAFCRLSRRTAGELIGSLLPSVVPGVETGPSAASGRRRQRRREAWFIDAAGRRVPMRYELGRGRADRGQFVVQVYELAGSDEADRVMRSSERRLEEVADNVMALIYLKRVDGRYLFANRHYEEVIGQSRDVIIGKTDLDLWPIEIANAYMSADRSVLAAGHAMEFEEPIPTEGGWGMWLSLKFPLFDEDGVIYGVGGISTDISDRSKAEAAIREARDEAERANRAKSEFLSRMSHELRTPLNSILGFGQLLQLEELAPTAATDVAHIVEAGRHLLALINEVLDIARIESGTQTLSLERLCVCDPIGDAYEMVRPLAAERGIQLVLDLHDALYQYVVADRQRLKQVVLNLLVNAVKYNRTDGIVTVSSRLVGDRAVRVLVTDTGAGIAPGDLDRVFIPFERLDPVGADAEGTGLGLALARSFAAAMGGDLGIERSTLGRGTVFYVELPVTDAPSADELAARALGEAAQGPDIADASADLGGRTILYIEDNLVNLEIVSRILDRNGRPQLLSATHGQVGLQLAAAHRPDLLLLDLHLPDTDGAEVLTALQSDERTRGIPVVVLSADATTAQREKLLALGATDYITKPIVVVDLLSAVGQALQVASQR